MFEPTQLLQRQGAAAFLFVARQRVWIFWHGRSSGRFQAYAADVEVFLKAAVNEIYLSPAGIHEVPTESSLEQRSQLLRIAAVIFTAKTAHRHRVTTTPISPDEHMNEVFERVSADELSVLSVGEMAEKFGFSRRHLNRIFRFRPLP